MTNLMFQSTRLCDDIGEARRHFITARQHSCPQCASLIAPIEGSLLAAYVRAEGVDLQKAIREFEDKHLPGAPLNQHLRQRQEAYVLLLREYDALVQGGGNGGGGGDHKGKGRPVLIHGTAKLPKAG